LVPLSTSGFRLRQIVPRVPPGESAGANQKLLEAVSPGPQFAFDAIELPAPLAQERQLALDVIERLGCELPLRFWVVRVLELRSHEAESLLGLEHVSGTLLCPVE